jgi:hypothetical protein
MNPRMSRTATAAEGAHTLVLYRSSDRADAALRSLCQRARDGGSRLTTTSSSGSLSVALAVAGFAAFPANRWLLKRGKGHAAVHETGIHGC